MKTSVSQFDMMVTYMEQHGDLSSKASGKLETLQAWVDLVEILNSDPKGEAKTDQKWKRVWTDLKNNTKKKVVRICKASSATGVGPAIVSKLTDLEQRVLNLLNTQPATSATTVDEAGVPQTITMQQADSIKKEMPCLQSPVPSLVGDTEIFTEDWSQAGSPSQHNITLPSQSPVITSALPHPATEGHTTTRQRQHDRSYSRRSTRKRLQRQSSVLDKVTAEFIKSDSEWRTFLIEKHQRKMEIEKERLRIRESNLEVHRQLQDIIKKALDIFEKVLEKN